MSPDEKLRQALNNHKQLIADAKAHEWSLKGYCQRTMRICLNGPRQTDPKWIQASDVPGLQLPELDTALLAAEHMTEYHDELGWDRIPKVRLGKKPGKYLAYFSGAGGFGHIAVVVFDYVGEGQSRKLAGTLYDNDGERPWTTSWAKRLIGAYRPKAD